MQLPTVLTLRHFSDFTEHARAFIPTVKPINYRAWTTTLCFAHRGFTRAESARRPDNGYERNQFAIYGRGTRSKVHSASCHVPRPDTHEMKGRFLGRGVGPQTWRKTLEGRNEWGLSNNAPGRKKKGLHFAYPECGSERGMTRERKLSILPVHRRFPANDTDSIQLCGKCICRIAKPRNYAARVPLKRITCWRNSRALKL